MEVLTGWVGPWAQGCRVASAPRPSKRAVNHPPNLGGRVGPFCGARNATHGVVRNPLCRRRGARRARPAVSGVGARLPPRAHRAGCAVRGLPGGVPQRGVGTDEGAALLPQQRVVQATSVRHPPVRQVHRPDPPPGRLQHGVPRHAVRVGVEVGERRLQLQVVGDAGAAAAGGGATSGPPDVPRAQRRWTRRRSRRPARRTAPSSAVPHPGRCPGTATSAGSHGTRARPPRPCATAPCRSRLRPGPPRPPAAAASRAGSRRPTRPASRPPTSTGSKRCPAGCGCVGAMCRGVVSEREARVNGVATGGRRRSGFARRASPGGAPTNGWMSPWQNAPLAGSFWVSR